MKFILETQEDWKEFSAYLASTDSSATYEIDIVKKRGRTLPQNRSLWKWLTMLSQQLNDAGFDRIKTLQALKNEPDVEIPNSKDSIYSDFWLKIQNAMLPELEGSSELDTKQISEVYEVANRYSIKVFGISIPWPDKYGGGQ